MDLLALTMFGLTTFLFALFVAAIMKFFVFRFIPVWGLATVPYAGWVIIIVAIMFALQFGGVNVAGWYSSFFAWMSKEVKNIQVEVKPLG